MHLFMINRGIVMTPFHNMALMCPGEHDRRRVHAHRVFRAAVAELTAS